jgi:hypothetical protein
MELDNCVEFQIRVRWSDISPALPEGSKSVLSGTKQHKLDLFKIYQDFCEIQ